MESNQKFFPVLNHEHRLTGTLHRHRQHRVAGSGRSAQGLRAGDPAALADAQFFYDEDLKQGIESMRAGLASVTYQQKLGSYADKSARVAELAGAMAAQVGVDVAQARRRGELSKADLQSRMVGEFPELQGIMGRYYASAIGEPGEIADAIDHAYLPRFGGDAIAPSALAQVLAVAERLDTLAGGFAAGLKPVATRIRSRCAANALGLARTIVEGGLEIDLPAAIALAIDAVKVSMACSERRRDGHRSPPFELWASSTIRNVEPIYDFMLDRLRGYYADRV